MNIRREDMIGIGCAFTGAALGAFVVAPLLGGTPVVFTFIGVVIGWSVAKVIIGHLDQAEQAESEARARAHKADNDTDFSRALYDEDGSDRS